MKRHVLYLLLLGSAFQWSCQDRCQQTRTFRKTTPVSIPIADLRKSFAVEAPRTPQEPGKIYVKDNFLFINEIKEGVHVYDNSNPSAPRALAFLKIPGNVDMAVLDNFLYADTYTDLLVLDITNPATAREVKRVEFATKNGVFARTSWYYDETSKNILTQKEEIVTETVQTDCDGNLSLWPYFAPVWYFGRFYGMVDYSFMSGRSQSFASSASDGGSSGTGGSMARFTISKEHLYVVRTNEMQDYNIKDRANPVRGAIIPLDFGVETIFPYKNQLYIGSQTGMYIYDITVPEKPQRLSFYVHIRACDPVVVQNDIAYVTLRNTGSFCGGTRNVLDAIDVSDPRSPRLFKSYPMTGPYGLGVDGERLFICEGKSGLKILDISRGPMGITQTQEFKNVDAFDVIPLNGTLMMVGKGGLLQYDYSGSQNLRLLSTIAVKPLF